MERQYYILDGKIPKRVKDVVQYSNWSETANKNVCSTELPNDITISTDFIGTNPLLTGIPLLFETMIFGGEHDGYQKRYKTWEEAEQGHKDAIILIFEVKN